MPDARASVETTYRKVAWRVIPFLFVCYLFNYLDRVNVGFAKLQMLDDLGLSETAYGLGAGIFFLGYLTFGVPSNLMLQRVGARRWIGLIMIVWGALSAAMMFVSSPLSFYTLRFLTGAAEAGFFPGIVLYLTRWFPPDRHGRAMTLFMAAIPVSGVTGSLISGWILGHFSAGQGGLAGWQWLFLLEGLPTIALGIAAWALLSDGIDDASWLDTNERIALHAALAHKTRAENAEPTQRLAIVARNPTLWLLGLLYFCAQSGVYAINFWLPTIIRRSGTTDPTVIGLLGAIPYFAATLFMIGMGRSADRREERRWHLAIPLGLGCVGLIVASAFAGSMVMALSGMTLATMGALASLPLFWPLANRYLSPEASAAGVALINSIGQIAGFASPYLVGWITDTTGSTQIALYALAGAMLVGLALVFRISSSGAHRR